MSEVLLLVAIGLVIGLVLGGLGGGGAVLTVPALVFLVGQNATEATSSSLVIVGIAAVAGAAGHVRAGSLAWRTGLALGVAGIPAAWLGSRLGAAIDPDRLLLGFAVLMVVAAVAMLRPTPSRGRMAAARGQQPGSPAPAPTAGAAVPAASSTPGGPDAALTEPVPASPEADVLERGGERAEAPGGPSGTPRRRAPWPAVVGVGLAVGLLTGFFGVGGGFVIVPALVLLLGLPMSRAVGTSLVVVSLNSAAALLSRLGGAHVDLGVVVPLALAAVVATVVGRRVAARLPAQRLQRAFAVLLVLVAAYTGVQAALGLAG